MAETAPARRLPYAGFAMIVAANLPDLDVLSYMAGGDAALGFRRGWTHGPVAWVVLPLLLWSALLLWDRARGALAGRGARLGLLTAILVAFASHPALDWLNVYGIRLLAPFDGRWFYGDTLFIVDPWIWLGLGATLAFVRRDRRPGRATWALLWALTAVSVLALGPPEASRWWLWASLPLLPLAARGARRPDRRPLWAALSLAALCLYLAGSVLVTQASRQVVARELPDGARAMVAPVLLDPRRREIVAEVPGESAYRIGRLVWSEDGPRLDWGPCLERGLTAAREARIASSPAVAGFRSWARFPWVRSGRDRALRLYDARYVREPQATGFGTAEMPVP